MKRFLLRTAAAFVAAVLLSAGTFAAQISAKHAIVMDADTGNVLYAENENGRARIASTTKIMTALLVLENMDPTREITVPAEACGIEGSSLYLRPNECLTVRELLYGLMMHSGNDAAAALALCCAGCTEDFVAQMNAKARELGLNDTHFANPSGLDDPQNYSTAHDLARLTAYALQNDEFLRIVSTKSIQIGTRSLQNHNRLLRTLDGAIGVKTGYTKAAGRILVSAAERNGRRLIVVTLNDPDDWRDHARLYDECFASYCKTRLLSRGEFVEYAELLEGGRAPLCAAVDVSCHCAAEERPEIRVISRSMEFLAGMPGEAAGWGGVFVGERCIATFPLIWGRQESEHGENSENSFGARCGIAPRSRVDD